MSIYYNFYCTKCSKVQKGISFAHMGWGWGNADIIDSFRFLMKHSHLCGHQHIKITREDEDIYYNFEKDTDDTLNGYYPCSDDWPSDVDKTDEWIKYQRYLYGDILEEEEVMTESKKDAPE